MKIQFPDILRPFMGKLTWRKNPSSKDLYITFDDGPVPEVTPDVIQILIKNNIKATFFCVGENVKKYPETYAQILHAGNKTGNHTFNHLKGVSATNKEYIANIELASKYIDSNLFRPPHGRITYSQRKALRKKYEIVMWDVLTCDYNQNIGAQIILENIKRYTRNGSIIVFHDSIKAKKNLFEVLPLAIEWWKKEGYEFRSL